MANIKLTLPGEPYTGQIVNFTAVCDCANVTGGIIINNELYTVVDAMGNTVTGVGGAWCAGAQVSVLLDCDSKKAYLQNGAKGAAHEHSADDITSGTLGSARLPTVPASKGGTGKTSLNASANALINALTEGTSKPEDADYFVAQYAGGGTTTTTYHRRKFSALWSWIKEKTDGLYSAVGHTHTAAAVGAFTNGTIAYSDIDTCADGAWRVADNPGILISKTWDANYKLQLYHVYMSGSVKFRHSISNKWSDWITISNDGHKHTPSQIGLTSTAELIDEAAEKSVWQSNPNLLDNWCFAGTGVIVKGGIGNQCYTDPALTVSGGAINADRNIIELTSTYGRYVYSGTNYYVHPSVVVQRPGTLPIAQRSAGYVVHAGTTCYKDSALTTVQSVIAKHYPATKVSDTVGAFTSGSTTYYFAWDNNAIGWGYAAPDNKFFIDRWRFHQQGGAYDPHTQTLLFSDVDSLYTGITQKLDNPERLAGKTVTLSALLSSNTPLRLRIVWGSKAADAEYCIIPVSDTPTLSSVTATIPADVTAVTIQLVCNTTNIKDGRAVLTAFKLELGDRQTLAHQDGEGNWVLNEVPDYGEEYAKCVQYSLSDDSYIGLIPEAIGAAPEVHTHEQSDITGLADALAGTTKVQYGTYTGDGNNSKSLTFDFKPLHLVITRCSGSDIYNYTNLNVTRGVTGFTPSQYYEVSVSWGTNSVRFSEYETGDSVAKGYHIGNGSGLKYAYIAFGVEDD